MFKKSTPNRMENRENSGCSRKSMSKEAQKLFSSDEASLLEEMDEAERIWAEEKIRDPNAISSMETAAANH